MTQRYVLMLEPLAQGLQLAAQIAQADPSVAAQVNYPRMLVEGFESLGLRSVLDLEETYEFH